MKRQASLPHSNAQRGRRHSQSFAYFVNLLGFDEGELNTSLSIAPKYSKQIANPKNAIYSSIISEESFEKVSPSTKVSQFGLSENIILSQMKNMKGLLNQMELYDKKKETYKQLEAKSKDSKYEKDTSLHIETHGQNKVSFKGEAKNKQAKNDNNDNHNSFKKTKKEINDINEAQNKENDINESIPNYYNNSPFLWKNDLTNNIFPEYFDNQTQDLSSHCSNILVEINTGNVERHCAQFHQPEGILRDGFNTKRQLIQSKANQPNKIDKSFFYQIQFKSFFEGDFQILTDRTSQDYAFDTPVKMKQRKKYVCNHCNKYIDNNNDLCNYFPFNPSCNATINPYFIRLQNKTNVTDHSLYKKKKQKEKKKIVIRRTRSFLEENQSLAYFLTHDLASLAMTKKRVGRILVSHAYREVGSTHPETKDVYDAFIEKKPKPKKRLLTKNKDIFPKCSSSGSGNKSSSKKNPNLSCTNGNKTHPLKSLYLNQTKSIKQLALKSHSEIFTKIEPQKKQCIVNKDKSIHNKSQLNEYYMGNVNLPLYYNNGLENQLISNQALYNSPMKPVFSSIKKEDKQVDKNNGSYRTNHRNTKFQQEPKYFKNSQTISKSNNMKEGKTTHTNVKEGRFSYDQFKRGATVAQKPKSITFIDIQQPIPCKNNPRPSNKKKVSSKSSSNNMMNISMFNKDNLSEKKMYLQTMKDLPNLNRSNPSQFNYPLNPHYNNLDDIAQYNQYLQLSNLNLLQQQGLNNLVYDQYENLFPQLPNLTPFQHHKNSAAQFSGPELEPNNHTKGKNIKDGSYAKMKSFKVPSLFIPRHPVHRVSATNNLYKQSKHMKEEVAIRNSLFKNDQKESKENVIEKENKEIIPKSKSPSKQRKSYHYQKSSIDFINFNSPGNKREAVGMDKEKDKRFAKRKTMNPNDNIFVDNFEGADSLTRKRTEKTKKDNYTINSRRESKEGKLTKIKGILNKNELKSKPEDQPDTGFLNGVRKQYLNYKKEVNPVNPNYGKESFIGIKKKSKFENEFMQKKNEFIDQLFEKK